MNAVGSDGTRGSAVRQVAVVDDDEALRRTVSLILDRTSQYDFHAEFASGGAALRGIREGNPQVVLLDIVMPRMDGIECTRRLLERCPSLVIVIMTGCSRTHCVPEAIAAGAAGFLLKPFSVTELIESLDAACAGRLSLQGEALSRLRRCLGKEAPSKPAGDRTLSARELEIMRLVQNGMTDRQIALKLGVSECTVKTHLHHVYVKLGVSCRAQAAIRVGALEDGGRKANL